MTREQLHDIEVLSEPLRGWLRHNGNPHLTFVVNSEGVKLTQDIAFTPERPMGGTSERVQWRRMAWDSRGFGNKIGRDHPNGGSYETQR